MKARHHFTACQPQASLQSQEEHLQRILYSALCILCHLSSSKTTSFAVCAGKSSIGLGAPMVIMVDQFRCLGQEPPDYKIQSYGIFPFSTGQFCRWKPWCSTMRVRSTPYCTYDLITARQKLHCLSRVFPSNSILHLMLCSQPCRLNFQVTSTTPKKSNGQRCRWTD